MTHDHPLFQRFPLDGTVVVAGETLTTPYHVYDGTILSIGGTVDGRAAADLLAPEQLRPLVDSDGRALAAIWVCDFAEANLGPHHELQISLFATARAAPLLPAGAFSYYRALNTMPDLLMVCHGLWNSTQRVVHYNREHLRLDAHPTESSLQFDGNAWAFRFRDADGAMIAEGAVAPPCRQPAAPAWHIARQMGLRGMLRLLRAPMFRMPVVGTRRQGAGFNHVSQTYTASAQAITRGNTGDDSIAILHADYRSLDFRITFLQQLSGVRFAFLRPSRLCAAD